MHIIIRWKPLAPRECWLFASAAGGVLVLTLVALSIHGFIVPSRPSAAENMTFPLPSIQPADLIVSEAAFVGTAESRRIAGVLKNRSGRTYNNIEMTFSLIGADGDNVGLATATVPRLEGHEAAKFEASGVTSKAIEIVLKQIEATPPLAGAQ